MKVETLNFKELLNVSNSSDLGHHLVDILYKWKHADKTVEISCIANKNIGIWNELNTIYIYDTKVEDFLKAFGGSIKKLSIVYIYISEIKLEEIGRLVNLYCSETLIEFQGRYFRDGSFENMQKPFKNVERVSFNGNWKILQGNSLSPDQLFPKLRTLDLTYTDGIIFDYNYPNLVELTTYIAPSSRFIKFIERNPQITMLRLKATTSVELLKTVNNRLVELDSLEFHWPNDFESYQDSVIQLNYVKNATIIDHNLQIRSGNIMFKQLEILRLKTTGQLDNAWINFIVANKQFKTLNAGIFNDSTLLMLLLNVNSLIEANIRCDNSVTIETIVQLLESNSQMKRITLDFIRSSISFFDSLSKKLQNEWNVAPVEKSFKKISLTKLESLFDVIEPIENDKNSILSVEVSSIDTATEEITNSTLTMEAITTIFESPIHENGASNVFSSIITVSLIAIVVSTIVF